MSLILWNVIPAPRWLLVRSTDNGTETLGEFPSKEAGQRASELFQAEEMRRSFNAVKGENHEMALTATKGE